MPPLGRPSESSVTAETMSGPGSESAPNQSTQSCGPSARDI